MSRMMARIGRGISTHSLTKRLTDWISISLLQIISTHSLTKRLTRPERQRPGLQIHFNSQPHEEADHGNQDAEIALQHFNSQPHEEADSQSSSLLIQEEYFNSQPHEEADGNFRQKYIYLKLFFTLIAHINLVFYSNHYIVNFFLVKYTHFLVRMS